MSHDAEDESRFRPISLDMVGRLAALLRSHARRYAWVCLSGLSIAVLEMIPPRLVGRAVDRMSRGHFDMRPVLAAAALWLALIVVTQILHALQIRLANRAGEFVLAKLRQDMFVHLQRLSMSYFDRTHAGRVLARFSGDIDSLRAILIWGVNTLVANAAIMLLASVMIFRTDRQLFLAVAWLAPAMTLLNYIYGRRAGQAWQSVRSHSTHLHTNQAENIAGAKVVLAFNRQSENLKRYRELNRVNTENNLRASHLGGVFQPIIQWMRFTGQAIILAYGGYRVAGGRMGAGDLVAVSLYWEWFMNPAVSFGNFFNDLLIAMASAERIFSLLDEIPQVVDAPGAPDLPALTGGVCFEDVSFGYRADTPVLREVSFTATPGMTVALVGATGSGKSSILSLLARFYQPQRGRVLIDGFDVRAHTGASLHRQMAMVLQANCLFTGSVMDNLRYARPEAHDGEIIEAARALGCHERFLGLKQGYQTPVGERGANLSLGERQLVCFTRAMVADPRLLLLDEATSAVDSLTEKQVQRALSRLRARRTTFVVAHRLSTIVNADLILVLEQGRIVERGTHAQLLQAAGRYAKLHAASRDANALSPAACS